MRAATELNILCRQQPAPYDALESRIQATLKYQFIPRLLETTASWCGRRPPFRSAMLCRFT